MSNQTLCPHCGKPINVGSLLGHCTSEAKARASRANGRKGGRAKARAFYELAHAMNPEEPFIELKDDPAAQEAQAKALGFMLDKVFPADKPLPQGIPETQAAISSELRDIESMFMTASREACIMEVAIIEALTWLEAGAQGRAYGTLSQVMEKLSAMRVKP